MEIDGLILKTVVFPGEAGEAQRRGSTASLIRALGDNYERYHRFLAEEFEEFGPEPDPDDYSGDIRAYIADCTRFVDILRAERIVRRCREIRGGPTADGVPLIDEHQQLVSALDWRPPRAVEAPDESSPRGPLMWPE